MQSGGRREGGREEGGREGGREEGGREGGRREGGREGGGREGGREEGGREGGREIKGIIIATHRHTSNCSLTQLNLCKYNFIVPVDEPHIPEVLFHNK